MFDRLLIAMHAEGPYLDPGNLQVVTPVVEMILPDQLKSDGYAAAERSEVCFHVLFHLFVNSLVICMRFNGSVLNTTRLTDKETDFALKLCRPSVQEGCIAWTLAHSIEWAPCLDRYPISTQARRYIRESGGGNTAIVPRTSG